MRYRNYVISGLGVIAVVMLLTFCIKKKSHIKSSTEVKTSPTGVRVSPAENPAVHDFKLGCLGETSKCAKTEISVTNIGHKSYDKLIIICTDKDDPNESEKDPHHNWPFSLEPNETKCMEAAKYCYKKEHKDKTLGKYYTLIQLNSSNDPIWKLGKDCEKHQQNK